MKDSQPKEQLCDEQNRLPQWSTAGVLFQVLMDEERTLKIRNTISHVIKHDDIVADIGTGTGILACFSRTAGAKKVYAIESDPSNHKVAHTVIADNNMQDVIELIKGDVLKQKLPEKVDVIICELMSTALLDEPQIIVMNYVVNNFLKKDGITIPRRAITFIEYVTSDYDHYDLKLRIPQYEWSWIPSRAIKISETRKLFEIDFTTINKEYFHLKGRMEITQSGLLNGIRLSTKTFLTNNITHDSSMGFCPPVVIPTKDEIEVNVGERVYYELSYKPGYGYASFELEIVKEKLGDLGGEKT